MKASVDEVIHTRYKGVSIVIGHSGVAVKIATSSTAEVEGPAKDSACRNLNGPLEEKEQLEATAAQLVDLS